MSWQNVRTLADLGECVAQYLEGTSAEMPLGTRTLFPAVELGRLRPLLIQLSRHGVIIPIDALQSCTPTERPLGGALPWQRASLVGFVPPRGDAVRWVSRAFSQQNELFVALERAGIGATQDYMMVGADEDGDGRARARLYFGRVFSRHEIALLPGLSPELTQALQDAIQLTVIDKQFGRNDLVWGSAQRLVERV